LDGGEQDSKIEADNEAAGMKSRRGGRCERALKTTSLDCDAEVMGTEVEMF
jgi:hypothetical protein